jgi:hypothetical protein
LIINPPKPTRGPRCTFRKVPGREERTEAHRNGGSTVRRCQWRRAATFVGGEGSPVVTGVAEEVLQLKRGKGGEEIARNPGDWKLGEELTGERRTAAEVGRNSRGRGRLRWPKTAVRVRGVAGRLERSREWSERGEKSGFRTEWRTEECARRQRG